MCLCPVPVKKHGQKHYYYVSCGKCPECKKYEANLWSNRMLIERPNWKNSFLITLTLNPFHYDFFEHKKNYKRYLQLMFKRMRKFGVKFRYFLVAENGSLNYRLHCHLIYYTNWVSIIQVWKLFRYYYNLGYINIKHCNNGAYRYLMKYLEKGAKFRLISKGIGNIQSSKLHDYIFENKYCHKYFYDKYRKEYGDKALFELKLKRDKVEKNRLFRKSKWKTDKNNPKNIKIRKDSHEWKQNHFI